MLFIDDDSDTTPLNTPVNIPVLNNDFDPDGDDLTTVDSIITQPTNGTVSILPDGTVIYTPDTGFEGNDEFQYRVCDSENLCAEATVTVEVGPDKSVPDGPVASEFCSADECSTPFRLLGLNLSHVSLTHPFIVASSPHTHLSKIDDDVATTPIDTPVDIPILNNDVSTSPLDIGDDTLITDGQNGTCTIKANSTDVTYTPDAGFYGMDVCLYMVCDENGLCDDAVSNI